MLILIFINYYVIQLSFAQGNRKVLPVPQSLQVVTANQFLKRIPILHSTIDNNKKWKHSLCHQVTQL